MTSRRRLEIAHIVYKLDFGGMENGLVNLVNRLPADEYAHTIICLTVATPFRERIRTGNVRIVELHKPAGNHLPTYWRLFRVLREIRPDVVHTRNLGTLDLAPISRLAGVRLRIHGEHGWDIGDPDGRSGRHRRLRRMLDPFISRYVAVSRDIGRWLSDDIRVSAGKVTVIHNGVDVARFSPRSSGGAAGGDDDPVVFGTVGRQDPIKGLDVFVEAVAILLDRRPGLERSMRVVMAGDGSEHQRLIELCERRLGGLAEIPGTIDAVPDLMRELDFMVQPSLNEGISNTVLEAMASATPVVATAVGGNPELIRDGVDGQLVPAADPAALADAIERYIDDTALRTAHGQSAVARARQEFSLDRMVQDYGELYAAARSAN